MKNLRLGVLVSGRGSNLQAIIDSINRKELFAEIAIVISDKANAPALERAKKAGVKAICIESHKFKTKLGKSVEQKYVDTLKSCKVDLIVLAGFMRVLHKTFLDAFAGRIINIHPSLLPSFAGLNAQKQALDYGVKFSGCTVHFVDSTVDGGKIIMQKVVPVLVDDTVESLSKRILAQEHKLLPEAINFLIQNQFKEELIKNV